MQHREMTLAEIQDFGLIVLEEFDSFCRKEGLRYSIAYGTLIGAIRHKAYIPWDDDIDVIMPRPDYDALLSLYRDSENWTLLWPGKNNCSLQYARLCDISRTRVKSKSPWHDGQNGVWIDIFPIDSVPDDLQATEKKYKRCRYLYHELLKRRRTLRYKASGDFLSKIKYIAYVAARKINPVKVAVELNSYSAALPYGSTGRVMNFTSPIKRNIVTYPLESFDKYVEVDFCGKKFMAVEDYDSCLRAGFGDYMQLPPESQRNRGHSFHSYTWL